jgi:transcriptional regulator with XRE-family HTH domain
MQVVDFKDRLAKELESRQRKNPRYSLRAFARLLGADHSTLSQIMRGARRPPISRIPAWAKKLGLAEEEVAVYVLSERIADTANDPSQEALRQWTFEAMTLVTERAHWEILRLAREPGFRTDTKWIAEQAGLSVDQVNMAFDRLLRLRLIESPSAGQWKDLTGLDSVTGPEFLKLALQRLREKAAEACADLSLL